MGKSSGGVRGRSSSASAPRIVGFKESEKAVLLEYRYMIEYAPSSGFTSSMVRYKNGTTQVWVPKSQIENGALSEWIASQKREQIADQKVPGRYVIDMEGSFRDATGRTVDVRPTAREQQYKAERAKRSQAALERAKQTRAALIAKAKANGYKAHDRIKTRTLELMAEGKYISKAEQEAQRIKVRERHSKKE